MASRPARSERIDYRTLNDGPDEEADKDDLIEIPDLEPSEASISFSVQHAASVTPSESVSEDRLARTLDAETEKAPGPAKKRRIDKESWVWNHFHLTVFSDESYLDPRTGKSKPEKEISCRSPKCTWRTLDSKRAGSTSNLTLHLSKKHNITADNPSGNLEQRKTQSSILKFTVLGKETERTPEETHRVLQENVCRWTVVTMQPFTAIETKEFQQIFEDIPNIQSPFRSATTIKRFVEKKFQTYQDEIVKELDSTCSTIALSLDLWTSKNQLSILAVIGHWLTEDFVYQERVLEFVEVQGVHTGENLAECVESILVKHSLERKLLTITADNATNNEALCEALYLRLTNRLDPMKELNSKPLRFQGINSLVRCLAHVVNLIVQQFLASLRTGDVHTADSICTNLHQKNSALNSLEEGSASAVIRIRILVLWIMRSPQRRQRWRNVCGDNGLPARFIEYDVETR